MDSGRIVKKPSFYGATAIMASSTFLSRILGLLRETVFAAFFGAGNATDAFQIAFRIPNLLRDLFAEGAMSSALVPVYTRLQKEKGEAAGWHLANNVITCLGLLTGLITVLGIFLADPLVTLFAGAFQEVPGKHEMTVHMTRLLWPFFPVVVMAAIWMGVLNSREIFGIPALAPTFFNVVSILAAFTICPLVAHFTGYPPIYGMAIGATLGGLAQWLVQVPSLRREGFRYRPVFQPRDPALRRMVALMGAGTFSLAATQVNLLVSTSLAAGQGEGAVSWLYYAFRLMQFPIGVFGVAISVANLTKVSREAAAGNIQAVRDSLRDALRMVIVLTVPSAIGLAVLGVPIVSVIFERGLFLASDTYQTSLALAAYSIGLSSYSANRVMVPMLYSLGKPKAAVWTSALGMVLNVGLCLALVGPLGFQGLAIALSIAAVANTALLLFILQSIIKQIEFKNLTICLLKTLCASLFMAIFVYVFLGFLDAQPFRPILLTGVWDKANFAARLLFLLAALGIGVSVFGVVAKMLRLQELERIQGLLWKRLSKRRDTE
jgi:putative peptidoglycan lipid II flippase